MKKKVYFDVCGTLFRVNTTFDFIIYFHRVERNYINFLKCLFFRSILGKALHKLLRFSMRNLFLSTIKGESVDKLDRLAEEYCTNRLFNKKIDIVFGEFAKYVNDDNFEVVLISASIDPVISFLGSTFSVESISSTLEYRGGSFTGLLSNDLKGVKEQYIKGFGSQNYAFYSDNLDDLQCHTMVEKYYFVRNRKRKSLSVKFPNVEILDV